MLTWLEINTNNISSNIIALRKSLPKATKFIAVIKANAYGHGLLEVASAIQNQCDYLAVFDFNDALILRKNNIKTPLFILGPTSAEQLKFAAQHDIEITVSNFETLKSVINFKNKKPLKIHLCIDSGMGRDGFTSNDSQQLLSLLKKHKNFIIASLYAHFAAADEKRFNTYTKKQINQLLQWQKILATINITPPIHHSATAGTMLGYSFDIARSGVGIYGLWASDELYQKYKNTIKLKPALSWKAQVIEVKSLPKGSCISYGCTYKLKRDSRLAILPIGYYDGVPRSASNKAYVIIKGKKVPQLGRVTMNMIIIDVTDVKGVKVGDIATIIGKEGKATITAEDWQIWANSLNYEITTRINPNMVRKVIK